ncbi:hypothetical protein [Bacillus sp. S/N-304-OC-R1]|uniref:hypothetical protein n=1 Tax=Bacillus sp. S/N-304-OC-R1 TaxID=2758034 RepID=UPI001C8E4A2E|nr:hypothetical protein [Bacillus sp. S/N-304-OC-R1]MBY0124499.1 hypothetical protein [Bacillus sp. S/N-304-OC-R1]
MYHMSESEFMQYEQAEERLKYLRKLHASELQDAYDGIHPTRTCFDSGAGKVYWESINPVDYAIYLVELREEHDRSEKWWKLRAEAFKDAFASLTEQERFCLLENRFGQCKERTKLRELLSEIIATRPELQRKSIPFDELEDIEEVDRRIDRMSDAELMDGYWDLDQQISEEQLREQCIRLRETHETPYLEISKLLGIEVARVKKYIKQHQREVS